MILVRLILGKAAGQKVHRGEKALIVEQPRSDECAATSRVLNACRTPVLVISLPRKEMLQISFSASLLPFKKLRHIISQGS